MLPVAIVDRVLAELVPHLEPGDVVIDGGNSWYHDDLRRSRELDSTGSHTSTSESPEVCGGSSAGIASWSADPPTQLHDWSRSSGPRSRCDRRAPDTRPDRRPHARGGRLAALRPERGRTLREDGAQRDRVRADGRLRRGSQHSRARERRGGRAGGRRRDDAVARPGSLPLRARSPRDHRAVAAGQRRPVVAARPHGTGAAGEP